MEQKLKKIMADIFRVQVGEITKGSSMDNLEEWDSLNHIQLISSIEKGFKILLKEEEIVNMISIANIKDVLRKKGIKL